MPGALPPRTTPSVPASRWSDEALQPGGLPGQDWLLWQLSDSSFPTGGFAHSGGLEAAWQHGEVRNATELATFIHASLWQFGHQTLPFMMGAHAAPEDLPQLDDLCEAFTTNHVANRASRAQGAALLASAERIFRCPQLQLLRGAAEKRPFSHLAPLFGVVTRTLGVERTAAGRLFLFLHLRGLTASAVRLGVAGPMEAQTLLYSSRERLDTVWDRCAQLTIDDLAQTAPLLDLWQAAQDRLYSRLFQS